MSDFNQLLRKIRNLEPEKKKLWESRFRERSPEGYEKFVLYLKTHPGAVHESEGYEHWLKRLGSHSFTRPFAPIQHRFWEWNWNALQKVIDNETLEPREKVGFLPWSREVGKSTHVEWACIAEGCLLRSGYVIYLSSKLSQAIDHVTAIRDRIESEKVAELYPWMSSPKVSTHGNKFGWGQEFLMTKGGWAIRPVGADVAVRGGKAINLRVTLIVIDDYDELGESPSVVEHKLHMLTHAILPMGNTNTRVLVPQNPIHANSVVNQMLTGASLALAIRTVFGEIEEDGSLSARPIPAVSNLAYEVRQATEGPYSVITSGESLWPGITIQNWEETLNRVSPDAFLAEYQHNLEVHQEERVLPEYDDRKLLLHVITWDMFFKMYEQWRIPEEWPCDLGVDIGYSGGPHAHLSSWSFMSKVPQGWALAGSVFRYRGRNFKGISVDDQSVAIQRDMWPDEKIERQWLSHEKLGERLLLNQKYKWHFHPCDSSKESGWPAWRHHLRTDRTQPHPFHEDRKEEDGLWRLGRPAFFDIVVASQLRSPTDDKGLKLHRDSAWNQRRRPVKLTDAGLTVDQPVKAGDDPNDSSRMIFSSPSFGPMSKPMTQAQRVAAAIPAGYHRQELERTRHPNDAQMTSELVEWLAKRSLGQKKPQLVDQFGQRI